MPEPTDQDDAWRHFLAGDLEGLERVKTMFRHIPSAPRCKLCQAPFGGIGGAVFRFTPWRRWQANGTICRFCTRSLDQAVGGAEVEATFLFADIRNSTTIAEGMRPVDYQRIVNHFYAVCAGAVDEAGGLVDKYLGDGVVAIFVPVFTGEGGPAASAIRAGRAILAGVGDAADPAARLPVGVGVHTGPAYVGVFGTEGGHLDFTGVGDAVNTAARLGSVASAGELLVSTDSATSAHLATEGLERRTLTLEGRGEPVDVVVLAAGASAAV